MASQTPSNHLLQSALFLSLLLEDHCLQRRLCKSRSVLVLLYLAFFEHRRHFSLSELDFSGSTCGQFFLCRVRHFGVAKTYAF